MSAKQARRERKKAHRLKRPLACDDCKLEITWAEEGNHNTPVSMNHTTWDGIAITAWCPRCGGDTCS